jgi:hypothetical protein
MNRRRPFAFLIATMAVVVVLSPLNVTAQGITGAVVLEGWGEPLADAVVLLMDDQFVPVDSVMAGEEGRFSLSTRGPGPFYLQARHGETFGPVLGPVEVEEGSGRDVELEFPSPLFRQALDCYATPLPEGTGVLAGMVFDSNSDMPLPGARVTLEWTDPTGRRTRDVVSSPAGRFVACAIPADVALTARVYSLGAVGAPQTGIEVREGALARHDLTMDLRRAAPTVRVVTDAGSERAGGLSTLTGELTDGATGSPVVGARVTIVGLDREMATDRQGRFRAVNLEPGRYTVDVSHLGYGRRSEALDVPAGSDVLVELRLAAQAIELGEITVRAARERLGARLAGAPASRTLAGERLVDAQGRGAPLHEALYDLPGIRLTYARRAGEGPMEACAEVARGRMGVGGGCNMIEVFLDGVAVPFDVAQELLMTGVHDYERIELLRPIEAMRWGLRASEAGALFLWTHRRGG